MALRLQRLPDEREGSACGKAVRRAWIDDTRPGEVYCCPGCAMDAAAPGRLARENPKAGPGEFGHYWDGTRLDLGALVERLASELNLDKGNRLYTLEASLLLGLSKPAAYRALRGLEERGMLVGAAVDIRSGDSVERFDRAGRTRGFVEVQFGAENAQDARKAAEELAAFAAAAAAKRVKKTLRENPSKKARRAKKAVSRAARFSDAVCACPRCEGLCQGLATGFGRHADRCEYCASGHRDY